MLMFVMVISVSRFLLFLLKIDKNLDKHQSDNEQNDQDEQKDGD